MLEAYLSELFDCPSKKLSAKMGYVLKKGGIIWIFSEKEELHGNTE